MANLIDGFREVRVAHRAQVQNDRRPPIEDQAAAAAPRGRAPSRTQSSSRDDKTPEYRTKGGQLVMADASKRGRSRDPGESRDRDETPEYPIQGAVLISDISNKKAKRTPQDIMRAHHRQNRRHIIPNKTNVAHSSSTKVTNILYSVKGNGRHHNEWKWRSSY